ncbi:hypothetical protein O0L34_g13939 [Tuta absoluta]|nr:hypothetical protein O0L34_g13939 [Tuta absoluta]
MKFTVVFVTVLSISWGLKVQEDPKDKREAPVGYHGGGGGSSGQSSHSYQSSPSFGGSGSGGQSSHSFQSSPSFGHGEASAVSGGQSGHNFQSSPSFGNGDASNAISIGAGYSIGGGAKPTFVYGAPEGGHQLQLSSEGLPSSGHATIQLPPITLQPGHGSLQSSDLHELMQQLSQGLNSGSLQLSPYQGEGHGSQGGHEQQYAVQQFSLGEPKQQQQQYVLQPEQGYASVPSYAAGTKGLGSYGSTGPVLFTPSPASESHGEQQSLTYGAPSAGSHSFDVSALSQAGSLGGFPLGEGGHGFGGHSLGGSGHSFGGLGQSGHSYGGASLGSLSGHSLSLGGLSGHSLGGLSIGGSGHSFAGLMKGYGGGYVLGGKPSFKPSVYLGSQGDSAHSFAGLSGSHGAPSFAGHSISGSHGLSLSSGGHGPSFGAAHGSFGGGSSKFVAQSYLPPKSKGFGASHDSVSAFSSSHVSPPRTTYGHPSGSSSLHSASSHIPKYYMSASKFPSFEGGSSFKAPSSGHSLSSFSSGPKYSFGSRSGPSMHYGAPKDIEGSYSENSYNTIKYSEELKPRA